MTSRKKFGQRKPPLSVTIKGILERYPDGQIFKVRNQRCVETVRIGRFSLTIKK